MADFPAYTQQPVGPVLAVTSMWSFGRAISYSVGGPSSGTWPEANLALFFPLQLPSPFVARVAWVHNGSAVAGNIDIGVYSIDGSLLVSTGSTAQAGTSTIQAVSLSEKLLQPGSYYLAMSCSSTSAAVTRNTYTLAQEGFGVLQAASQVPLANLPTFATTAYSYQPMFGISSTADF